MLRPQDTASRERKTLNGLWDFRLDATGAGQRGTVPALTPTGACRVEAEVPQAVQRLALAARGVLGTKHRCSPLIAG